MHKIYTDIDPYASFYFQAANISGEPKSNTKRFRVYRGICSRVFNPVSFEHFANPTNSSYIIVNQTTPDLIDRRDDILRYVQAMESELYN